MLCFTMIKAVFAFTTSHSNRCRHTIMFIIVTAHLQFIQMEWKTQQRVPYTVAALCSDYFPGNTLVMHDPMHAVNDIQTRPLGLSSLAPVARSHSLGYIPLAILWKQRVAVLKLS